MQAIMHHTYIHTYIRTYIHTYIHMNIHTYIHMILHTCKQPPEGLTLKDVVKAVRELEAVEQERRGALQVHRRWVYICTFAYSYDGVG